MLQYSLVIIFHTWSEVLLGKGNTTWFTVPPAYSGFHLKSTWVPLKAAFNLWKEWPSIQLGASKYQLFEQVYYFKIKNVSDSKYSASLKHSVVLEVILRAFHDHSASDNSITFFI